MCKAWSFGIGMNRYGMEMIEEKNALDEAWISGRHYGGSWWDPPPPPCGNWADIINILRKRTDAAPGQFWAAPTVQ